jgi:nucleotide-binding universal stress UspA family protein
MNECLIALDLAEGSLAVLRTGLLLAEKLRLAPALLHIDEYASRFARTGLATHDLLRMSKDYRESASSRMQSLAQTLGASLPPLLLTDAGNADACILEHAKSRNASCIVIGAHRQEKTTRILGHNVQRIVRQSPCPVFSVNVARPSSGIERVLLAADLEDEGQAAARWAAYVAGSFGAELVLLHVPEGPLEAEPAYVLPREIRETRRSESDAALRALADETALLAASYGVGAKSVRCVLGPPRDEAMAIIEAARSEAPDLLVLGTHGRRGLARAVFGSVAERVLGRAECAVLTVRR